MSATFTCQSIHGRVTAQCDAADLPKLARFTWRYQAKRGVVTRDRGTQMQASSLLVGWTQVVFINGNRLDLRRCNLGKLTERGGTPRCQPMRVNERLWRVQRIVGKKRLQLAFSEYDLAKSVGERLRLMTKDEVLRAIEQRQRSTRRSNRILASQIFDGREDMQGHELGADEYGQMNHAVQAS